MTLRDALRQGSAFLSEKGPSASETPALDASLLLASALGITRDKLLASAPDPIIEADLRKFEDLLGQRAAGAPVAYLLGGKEFWGHDFHVDRRVLIPRPDTELLVELAFAFGDELAHRSGRPALRVHEACTGSGCVAISLAMERPGWLVSASDLSEDALEVAAVNARLLLGDRAAALALSKSDLLAGPLGSAGCFDLILANPPYVGSAEALGLSAAWGEPLMALDGGPDGLGPYRRLIPQASAILGPGGCLLLEADPSQAAELRDILASVGLLAVETRADLAGLARVTLGRKPWTN